MTDGVLDDTLWLRAGYEEYVFIRLGDLVMLFDEKEWCFTEILDLATHFDPVSFWGKGVWLYKEKHLCLNIYEMLLLRVHYELKSYFSRIPPLPHLFCSSVYTVFQWQKLKLKLSVVRQWQWSHMTSNTNSKLARVIEMKNKMWVTKMKQKQNKVAWFIWYLMSIFRVWLIDLSVLPHTHTWICKGKMWSINKVWK